MHVKLWEVLTEHFHYSTFIGLWSQSMLVTYKADEGLFQIHAGLAHPQCDGGRKGWITNTIAITAITWIWLDWGGDLVSATYRCSLELRAELFRILEHALQSVEGLWKHPLLDPPQVSALVDLRWTLRICVSNKFPGDAAACSLGSAIWESPQV